jgi:hypothetical protein
MVIVVCFLKNNRSIIFFIGIYLFFKQLFYIFAFELCLNHKNKPMNAQKSKCNRPPLKHLAKKNCLNRIFPFVLCILLSINSFSQSTTWDLTLNDPPNLDMCRLGTVNSFPIRFFTESNERMRLDVSGNFGIGNLSPSSLLSVGSTQGFRVNNSGNITHINGISYSFPTAQAAAADYILGNDGSGNLSWINPASLFSSDNFWSIDGNSGTNANTNYIGTNDAQPLVFKTNASEQMRLLTSGYLGIGIPTPQSSLHLHGEEETSLSQGNSNSGTSMSALPSATIAFTSLQITNKTSGISVDDGLFLSLSNNDVVLQNKESGHIKFQTSKTAMQIFPNGNIGMGTTQGDAVLNLTAINQHAVSLKMINAPNSCGLSIQTNKAESKSFVNKLGNTENFLIFGNGETQIMDGMQKFYFGSCENVQNAAGNPVYATNYMGFNAIYDGTNWNCATNGYNNGGAVIWSTVGGDICFSNFETNSFQPQGNQNASIAGSELVENRTLMIHKHGSVSIGGYHTDNGNYKLAVHGTIAARKIIANQNNWYDHVFAEDYNLMSIEDLNSYIRKN